MSAYVLHQTVLHTERSWAGLASERFLACVYENVPPQMARLSKPARANIAAIRPLSRVRTHVHIEAPVPIATVWTQRAGPGSPLLPIADKPCSTLNGAANTCSATGIT